MRKIKKILACIFACILIFSIPVSASGNMKVSVDTVQAKKGEEVVIKISVENNPGFNYMKIKVSYDSNAMSLISANNSTTFSLFQYMTSKEITTNPYVVQWSGTSNVAANGTLVELVFKISENASKNNYPIGIFVEQCFNESDEKVTVISNNGVIILNSSEEKPSECNHIWEWVVVQPATCTESGRKYQICKKCGDIQKLNTAIPMNGHEFSAWETIKAPSVDEYGERQRKCKKCSEIQTEVIDKIKAPIYSDSSFTISVPDFVKVGDTFTVSVSYDQLKGLIGGMISLKYDESILEYVSSKFELNNAVSAIENNEGGIVNASFCWSNICQDESGKIFSVMFKAQAVGTVHMIAEVMRDCWDSKPHPQKAEIKLNVVSESAYLLGDVNNDGKITAADARLALRISAKLETVRNDGQFLAADTDKNKKITAADARKILRVAAKLEKF